MFDANAAAEKHIDRVLGRASGDRPVHFPIARASDPAPFMVALERRRMPFAFTESVQIGDVWTYPTFQIEISKSGAVE